jgi:hypothetical protein
VNAIDLLRQLQEIESQLMGALKWDKREQLQGERDQLLRELCDNEGAHDRRPVAVR